MDFILGPLLTIGGLGLLLGACLGIAGKIFEVKADPRFEKIKSILPGANCGGCGFAGCAAFAEALMEGETQPNCCPVGGQETATKVGDILGVDAGTIARKAAYVKCGGYCDKSKSRYDYAGIDDCVAGIMLAGGGSKECQFGCLGLGSCVHSCQFGAIRLVNDLAVIDPDKCTACGACLDACPKSLIEFAYYESGVKVLCNSTEKGKDVKAKCTVGCIGCKLCEKNCPYDAVHVTNMLAKIDYDKCTNCGECVLKCPAKTIKFSLRRKG